MRKLLLLLAISWVSVSMYAGQAFAISVSDVTLNGNNADFAYGEYDGNDTAQDLNSLNTSAFGTGSFQKLDKTDEGSAPIGTTTFTIARGQQSGTFILSWIDSNMTSAKWFDLVFALKAANDYAYYLFNDVKLSEAPGSFNGTYVITWLTGGGKDKEGNIPDLSHASVYGRLGTSPPPPVPEPATMLLFGAGLVGLAGIARRKIQ